MYNIEDSISFFDELEKEVVPTTDEKICCISHLPLEEDFVTLECGHTYNYVYLFHELYNKRFNTYFSALPKNLVIRLRCPYCRTTQKTVIPYSEKRKFGKIYGINDLNCEDYKNVWKCKYVKKSKVVCNCNYVLPLKETGIYYCEKHYKSSLNKYIKENTPNLIDKCSFKEKRKCPNKLFQDGLCKKHYNLKINTI
jgi:hypothetical protein